MGTRVFYLLMVAMVTAQYIEPEVNELTQRIVRSDDVDGYSLATLHAVDTATGQLIGQTKRDIEAHASDATSDKSDFSLVMSSGEHLRMTLNRRSIDTSAATVTELKEDGKREVRKLQARDCYFSGPLVGEKGFASLTMCGGRLMGSVSTAKRQYEIHSVADSSNNRRSADDAMLVLVKWQNTEHAQSSDGLLKRLIHDKAEKDGLEVPHDDDDDDQKRSVGDRKVTIEVADMVDAHQVNDLASEEGVTTSEDIENLIISKWSTIAARLHDPEWITWDITLKMVDLQIWRINPDWYTTDASDKMITRMRMVCDHFRNDPYDHIMLHTGYPIVPNGKVGVSWIGGFCSRYKCSTVRSAGFGFFNELHEFGHSLGLSHENQMAACADDTDTKNGFMGGNPYHFRGCYRPVFDDYFTKSSKSCIYTDSNPNLVKLLTN